MPLPLFSMSISGQPIAIIKSGDRQLQFYKVKKFLSKYFSTSDGVYELDDQYEYRYKKGGVYFYNFSNPKPIRLTSMVEIDKDIRKAGQSELFNRQRFEEQLPPEARASMTTPDDISSGMSSESRRFLADYQTDDEFAKTDLMVQIHAQKGAVQKHSGPLVPFGANRGDFAIVQIGHMRLDICQMYMHNDRAYTKYGVFEVSRDNIYLYKKQIVCMFVVNNTEAEVKEPMNKKQEKMLKSMVKDKEYGRLESFIKPFKSDLSNTTPHELRRMKQRPTYTEPPKIPKNVSISTEKTLAQYTADSPSIFLTTLKELHRSKEAVATKLSDPLKKALPIVVIFGAVMGVAVVVSNMPPIIDSLFAHMGVDKYVVEYITPEQAVEMGIPLDPEKIVDPDAVPPEDTPPPEDELEVVGDGELPPDYIPGEVISEEEMTMSALQCGDGMYWNATQSICIEFEELDLDLEAPVIIVPETIRDTADNATGMIKEYQVFVTDNVDENVTVTCTPPSGKVFKVGETAVLCTAIDQAGNRATNQFLVIIEAREGATPPSIIPSIPSFP